MHKDDSLTQPFCPSGIKQKLPEGKRPILRANKKPWRRTNLWSSIDGSRLGVGNHDYSSLE
jgi:hypothetical protein